MNAEFQFKHEIPVQIRFSDVDQYGHMNNSVYFSLYDLAKTSYFRDVFGEEERDKFNVVVVNINADFLAPVFFSDELMIETTVIHLGHKSLTMIQRAFNKVGYDILTKEPMEIPMAYKQAICDYEGKTLSELSQPIQ